MARTIKMPQLGESVVEGEVAEWFVSVGDHVEEGDPLLEVETEKANTDVPATEPGYIKAILAAAGETVAVGQPLLIMVATEEELAGDASAAAEAAPEPQLAKPAPAAPAPAAPAPTPAAQAPEVASPPPAAHKPIAITANPGQRPWNAGGVVAAPGTQPIASLAVASSSRSSGPAAIAVDGPVGAPVGLKYFRPPKVVAGPGDTVVKFTKRRGIIAEHMVYSKHVTPHVPCFAEVDMTDVMNVRRAEKGRLKEQGVNLTILAFLLKATVIALREFPTVNAAVGDGEYVIRGAVHLGIAVETEAGLVVPVIRNADELSVGGLARAVSDVADRARNKKITVDDLTGGTFTVSNPGRNGNLFGAAVINQPQVGILRMGEIVRRPMVRVVDGDEVIAIRSMMYLSLSYDHRIIDGVTGNSFLFRCRQILEQADMPV